MLLYWPQEGRQGHAFIPKVYTFEINFMVYRAISLWKASKDSSSNWVVTCLQLYSWCSAWKTTTCLGFEHLSKVQNILCYFCKTALRLHFGSLRYSMHKLSDFQLNLWATESGPSSWLLTVCELSYCWRFHKTLAWQRERQDLMTKHIQIRLKQACALLWTLI